MRHYKLVMYAIAVSKTITATRGSQFLDSHQKKDGCSSACNKVLALRLNVLGWSRLRQILACMFNIMFNMFNTMNQERL